MYDEQTRINATISYLFLGPIFLLAKKGTPLAEKYVQDHAKRASLLVLMSLGVYIVYFLLRDILAVSLFGIPVATVILGIIVTLTLAVLLHGAYSAFSGRETSTLKLGDIIKPNQTDNEGIHLINGSNTDVSSYSDALRIRIVASFLPFIGIFLASRYPERGEIRIGGKIGSFMTAVIFFASILTHSAGMAVLLSVLYIGLIVVTMVGLFVQKQFLTLGFYAYIPSYIEFEAHIFAVFRFSISFVKVILGSEKEKTYRDVYHDILTKKQEKGAQAPDSEYFMPIGVVAIPLFNLITLPSYFQESYRSFRGILVQGFALTFLFVVIWAIWGWNSSIQTILLFPIIHLLCYARQDIHTRAPIVSLGISLTELFARSRDRIDELSQKEEKVSFTYDTEDGKKEVDEKISNI